LWCLIRCKRIINNNNPLSKRIIIPYLNKIRDLNIYYNTKRWLKILFFIGISGKGPNWSESYNPNRTIGELIQTMTANGLGGRNKRIKFNRGDRIIQLRNFYFFTILPPLSTVSINSCWIIPIPMKYSILVP